MNKSSKFKKLYNPTPIVVDNTSHKTSAAKSVTKEDIEKIKQEAYASGYLAGKSENDSKAEIERRKEALEREFLYNLNTQIENLGKIYENEYENLISEIKNLISVLFEKAFPTYAKELCLEEVFNFLTEHLNNLKASGEIKVFVNEQNVKSLKDKMNRVNKDTLNNNKITILGAEDLELIDCKVDWETGSLQKRTAKIIEEMQKLKLEPKNILKTKKEEIDG